MLAISPNTRKLLDHSRQNLPQSILIHGPDGIGLLTLAQYLASERIIATVAPEGDKITPSDIKIDQIRQLEVLLRGKYNRPSVVIIDGSDHMNGPAQNALLKLLEEPPRNIHFILTAHNIKRLLPTILSRVQQIPVQKISKSASLELIQSLTEDPIENQKIQQLLFLAEGLPAELSRLVTDEAYFDRYRQAIDIARELVNGDRITKIHQSTLVSKDRDLALLALSFAIKIIESTLPKQPSKSSITKLENLAHAHDMIRLHGNINLIVLGLAI